MSLRLCRDGLLVQLYYAQQEEEEKKMVYKNTTENEHVILEWHECGCVEFCSKKSDFTTFNFCPKHFAEFNEKCAQLRGKFIYQIKNGEC